MFKSSLTDHEIESFTTIHSRLIPKRKDRYSRVVVIQSPEKKLKLEHIELVKPMTDKAISILKQNKITDFDEKYYCVEFHQRNCGFESKPYELFSWHKDDYGPVSYKVYSIIFYLRKDSAIKGGDLEYKDPSGSGSSKDTHIHRVKRGDILCFRGDLEHNPQPTSGFGCRDIIVCLIKRKN